MARKAGAALARKIIRCPRCFGVGRVVVKDQQTEAGSTCATSASTTARLPKTKPSRQARQPAKQTDAKQADLSSPHHAQPLPRKRKPAHAPNR